MNKYDLNIADINGEVIAFTNLFDEPPVELLKTFMTNAGGRIYITEYRYGDNGEYLGHTEYKYDL